MPPDLDPDPTPATPTDSGGNWFDRLSPHGALFSVGTNQRVARWGTSSSELLGEASQALGRHCYEVLASLDPRNGARCRPNCAVMVAARRGQPLPDFEVWLPDGQGSRHAEVSVVLHRDERGEVSEVLHFVRERSGPPLASRTCGAEGHPDDGLRTMLSVLTGADAEDESRDPPRLTARHREVLSGLAVGESVEEIADRLGLSAVTVRNHVQTAMERLGAHSRLEAVLTAVAHGLL